MPAYIAAFLEDLGRGREAASKTRYRCRVCGREWEKRPPAEEGGGKRPSLVRLTKE